MLKSEKGIALVAAIVFTCILTILGFSVLSVANSEIKLARKAVNKTKAFYLAEAALEIFVANASIGQFESIEETALGEGTYLIDYHPDEDPPYAIATGKLGKEEKSIKVAVSFLAPPYECGIYAGGSGGEQWTLMLRGQGNPQSKSGGEVGGKDIINGNIFVDGDVDLYEESSVNPAPWPNTYELNGDVEATGDVNLFDSASVSGEVNEGVAPQSSPDLVGMNYATNNTHNVSQIFADAGVSRGTLPYGNELCDVFQINPSNMTSECASTPGDDYFLTTSGNFTEGTWKTAETYLDAGEDRVYYIDGDLWVHSKSCFGFKVDGKVTIVATGDIHLCDNLEYYDSDAMLGLVALGKYDGNGNLISGGNVYFGDPTTGTLYTASAMMFAANNFLYNSTAIGTYEAEPESGFVINGSLIALNQIDLQRDWYTESTYKDMWGHTVEERKPCFYDPTSNQWFDAVSEGALTPEQVDTIKHYQMILNYDDRVRSQTTQPLGLPKGEGTIFEGLTNWEELPSS